MNLKTRIEHFWSPIHNFLHDVNSKKNYVLLPFFGNMYEVKSKTENILNVFHFLLSMVLFNSNAGGANIKSFEK